MSKIPKLTSEDVLEKEFLVAQSLSFEFWVHGADKALRGWTLDMQVSDPCFALAYCLLTDSPQGSTESATRGNSKGHRTSFYTSLHILPFRCRIYFYTIANILSLLENGGQKTG